MIGPQPIDGGGARTAVTNLLANAAPFAMYKMEINGSGQLRVSMFRGPGCPKIMLACWYDHLDRAEAGEDIRSIRVWGTVGNKT